MSSESRDSIEVVAEAVTRWMDETETLQAQVQAALEQIWAQPGIGAEAQRLIEQLLIVLRQRRSQTPTPDMVRTWLRTLKPQD